MNQRQESAIEAYRDGELSPRRRRSAERQLAEDGEAQGYLRSGEALSRLVRESWADGPSAPPPERFLAAIRPELARIDAERARRAAERAESSWLRGWTLGWTEWLRPLPVGGISAFAGAAAVALLALNGLWQLPAPESPSTAGRFGAPLGLIAQAPLAGEDEPAYDSDIQLISDGYGKTARAPFSSSTSIYDVHQGDAGLLIYDGEDDSPLLIFALPDEADGDDSLFQPAVLGGSNS